VNAADIRNLKHAPNMALRFSEHKDLAGDKEVTSVSFEWENFEKFDSDTEWMTRQGVRPHATAFSGGGLSYMGSQWLGGPRSAKEFMDKVRNGWPELRQELAAMMEGIELELPQVPNRADMRRRKRHRDDHGDTLDMTRVWNGDIGRAWERPVREDVHTVSTKRVTVCVDVMSHAGITNSEAMWRAALAVALCDSLAKTGRVFEVWTSASYTHLWQYGTPLMCWHGWCAKRTTDPLNLDRLCSMVSVGFLRVPSFWAAHAVLDWHPTGSYGHCGNSGLPHTLQERKDAGEVVLRIDQCYNKRQMLAEYARAWKEVEAHAALAHQEHVA
jgi:hypothetical protein